MPQDPTRRYRALAGAARERSDATRELHLIREDSETSLCGIPRVQLAAASAGDLYVCTECVDWLPKRVAFSGVYPKVEVSNLDRPKLGRPDVDGSKLKEPTKEP